MKTATRLFATVVAVAAGFVLVGCESNGGAGPGAQAEEAGDILKDEAGDVLVRLVSMDDSKVSTEGTVSYTIENVSGRNLENLLYAIEFRFEPSNPAKPFDNEIDLTRPLQLYADKPVQTLTGNSEQAVGKKSMGTKLRLEIERPWPTATGTAFMNRLLRCVDVDGLFESPIQPVLHIENASSQNVGGLEVQCVFLEPVESSGREPEWKKVSDTSWQLLASAGVGETVTLTFDLSAVPVDQRTRNVWIRVRQASLF